MSYNSRVCGEVEIRPPLPWSVIRSSPYYDNDHNGVRYRIDVEEIDTDEGVFVRRQAVAIVPTYEDAAKYVALEDDVRGCVEEVIAAGSYPFGAFIRSGESQGDVERLFIATDGTVEVQQASSRWPDGTEVDITW